MKMHDMGKEEGMETSVPTETKKTKYYPSFSMDSDKLPELKGVIIGDEIDLVIIGAITEVSQSSVDKKVSYRIEIRKAGIKNIDMTDELAEREKIKVRKAQRRTD